MKKHLLVFVTVFVLGVVLGTLGTFSFPVGVNITYFWPAAALQTVCGIFFGIWGILAGVIFPIVSNALTDGSWAHIIGFIPANVLQCMLPLMISRKFKVSLELTHTKDILLFILGCAALPHVVGSIIGCLALYILGGINNSAQFWKLVSVWIIGNVPCSVVFGFLMVKILMPVLKDSNLYYEGYLK